MGGGMTAAQPNPAVPNMMMNPQQNMMAGGMGTGMGGMAGGVAQAQPKTQQPMKGPGTPSKPKDPFQDLLM